MRLVAQDKSVDVPYEKGCVLSARVNCRDISKNQPTSVYFYADFTPGQPIELAKYSSEEKALKAMEMLRDKYLREKSYDDGKGGVLYATRNSSMSTVFQFPKDDEIEI